MWNVWTFESKIPDPDYKTNKLLRKQLSLVFFLSQQGFLEKRLVEQMNFLKKVWKLANRQTSDINPRFTPRRFFISLDLNISNHRQNTLKPTHQPCRLLQSSFILPTRLSSSLQSKSKSSHVLCTNFFIVKDHHTRLSPSHYVYYFTEWKELL